MNSNQRIGEPSGIRLMRLMDTRLFGILRRERSNESRVCLYGTGDHWVAFEQSAYQLWRLFPMCDISVATHPEYPFPVVLASISDDDLRALGRRHIFRRNDPDYKELIASEIPTDQYYSWHRVEVGKYIE